jgi:hypothetical protein
MLWSLAAIVGAVSGCAAVYATHPVGEAPVPLRAADWDGTWFNKDGALTLKVEDEGAGRIRMAYVEWGDQGPRLESHEIQLLRSGNATFASVKEAEENGQALYVWARIKREGNLMLAWIPNAERFKAACRDGRFPCREKDEDIALGELTADHLKILASEEEGSLYGWDEPVVLMRMNGGAD